MAVEDTEWVLSYENIDIHLGLASSTAFFPNGQPQIGAAEVRSERFPRPRGDGVIMGQDYLGGRTISFDLGVNLTHSQADAYAKVDLLAMGWQADDLRKDSREVAQLFINTPGRERCVFGRPTRFAPLPERDGYISVLAEFETVDSIFYDGELQTEIVNGGSSNSVAIGGRAVAWPIFTIFSPTNPVISFGDIDLEVDVSGGGTITINTRPWVSTVLQGVTNVSRAGKVPLPLWKCGLTPGSHSIAATGCDHVNVQWRDSHTWL